MTKSLKSTHFEQLALLPFICRWLVIASIVAALAGSAYTPGIAALRLYFPVLTKAEASKFWHHLAAPALAHHLLSAAKHADISQAMLHHVKLGYLPDEQLSHHYPELTAMRHPQCLELIDTEPKLRDFMRLHAKELAKVHAVLFQCELMLEPASGVAEGCDEQAGDA